MYLLGEEICPKTSQRWLELHGFSLSKPLTTYEVKAKSDRETMTKLYTNLKILCQYGQYPDSLVFNMDETWVSIEQKQPKGCVVHMADTPPISFQPTEGKRVTLIACISNNAIDVPPVYILQTYLTDDGIERIHGLHGIKTFYQRSGFMTNEIMLNWLVQVLIPHVNTRRSRNQHALLICNALLSRHNASVWNVLKANNTDMLVLPAHVTSIVQLPDVGIFAQYKQQFRDICKGKGGVYRLLQASVISFEMATNCVAIDKAWDKSKLFSPDWIGYVNSFPEQPFTLATAHIRRSKANYIVISLSNESLGWV